MGNPYPLLKYVEAVAPVAKHGLDALIDLIKGFKKKPSTVEKLPAKTKVETKPATEDSVDIFEEKIIKTPAQEKYQRAKAKVDPKKREPWHALSVEDKQKHLLEQFELIASGQKTKEAVANELGYVGHNWKSVENAAGIKYKDWIKTQPQSGILSQEFKVKSTTQDNKEIIKALTPERIDPDTGYVMKIPSLHTKRKILEILENTKALQPENYKWSDQEFSRAFANEYKQIFPGTFKGTGGSNKYQTDRDLAQLMLDFQGSNIKLEHLPTTLRYGASGVQKDITRGGIQSNKAAWEQTAIGDRTTGLALKHAKTQLLDLDGTWNSAKSSIYRDPIISDFLEPIKKNVAGGFDIDHITPIRFGGTNQKPNLRLIIKGSHKGETLAPGMTPVNAAVKNKSAMEDEVFKLNEKMINLVINKKYREALDIKQDIQTIVNNFKKTNPNTDFGIGMPHVVVKTGDNTASNVRLIDYLQLDDTTKKLIETDFIVYEKNLPSAGKSLEKTAEEVGQMYQPFIDAAGGELPPDIAKQLFEYADGGFASIEEVIGYNNGG